MFNTYDLARARQEQLLKDAHAQPGQARHNVRPRMKELALMLVDAILALLF